MKTRRRICGACGSEILQQWLVARRAYAARDRVLRASVAGPIGIIATAISPVGPVCGGAGSGSSDADRCSASHTAIGAGTIAAIGASAIRSTIGAAMVDAGAMNAATTAIGRGVG